jgi:L-fucose isomerase-like protein
MIKLGVIFLGRKRPGFDPEWGKQMEQATKTALAKTDYNVVVRDEYVVDDASLREALADMRKDGVNVLAVLQPTMSDGRFAPVLSQIWGDPLVLWATPEKQDYSMISACSLVGLHTFASTLRQLQKPFEIVYGMPGESETMEQLDRAVRIAYAASRLRQGKVGLIGYHAPGFIDMQADPFQMSTNLGLELWHTGLKDLVDRMDAMPEQRVKADVESVLAMGMPLDDVTEAEVAIDCRSYLAMSDIIEEESLDVLAIRDWGELPNLTGQWPYLAMVRFLTDGFPVACEGDTDGGISLLMGKLLGLEPGYLSDWLEHDHDTVTLWHAGNGSLNLCDPIGSPHGPRLAQHFNIAKPLVVNSSLKVGAPITIARLWRCDDAYHMMATDAETIQPKRVLKGTNGLAAVPGKDVIDWFDDLCHAGMPHHVAVFPGHHTETLRRFARQIGVGWVL